MTWPPCNPWACEWSWPSWPCSSVGVVVVGVDVPLQPATQNVNPKASNTERQSFAADMTGSRSGNAVRLRQVGNWIVAEQATAGQAELAAWCYYEARPRAVLRGRKLISCRLAGDEFRFRLRQVADPRR